MKKLIRYESFDELKQDNNNAKTNPSPTLDRHENIAAFLYLLRRRLTARKNKMTDKVKNGE